MRTNRVETAGQRSVCHIECLLDFLVMVIQYIFNCGVMVIIVGNGHGDSSSNPGRDWLHFT